jgi:hypothetical protein
VYTVLAGAIFRCDLALARAVVSRFELDVTTVHPDRSLHWLEDAIVRRDVPVTQWVYKRFPPSTKRAKIVFDKTRYTYPNPARRWLQDACRFRGRTYAS